MINLEPCWQNHHQQALACCLLDNFQQKTGRPLLAGNPRFLSFGLYRAPFAVLAHSAESDPLFTYANWLAQQLFAKTWADFLQTPSRLSAEAENRQARAKMLAQAADRGFIEHYTGIRIAGNGRRFRIKDAVIWNLHAGDGRYLGQAACFSKWQML